MLANADRQSKGLLGPLHPAALLSSFLVRTFAWIVILGRQGPFNQTLWDLGLERIEMLYSWGAVVLGMVNVLVPFAVLTMVA